MFVCARVRIGWCACCVCRYPACVYPVRERSAARRRQHVALRLALGKSPAFVLQNPATYAEELDTSLSPSCSPPPSLNVSLSPCLPPVLRRAVVALPHVPARLGSNGGKGARSLRVCKCKKRGFPRVKRETQAQTHDKTEVSMCTKRNTDTDTQQDIRHTHRHC